MADNSETNGTLSEYANISVSRKQLETQVCGQAGSNSVWGGSEEPTQLFEAEQLVVNHSLGQPMQPMTTRALPPPHQNLCYTPEFTVRIIPGSFAIHVQLFCESLTTGISQNPMSIF